MQRIQFDRPVRIALGKSRRPRIVRTIVDAAHCLRSESWPTRDKPAPHIATKALEAATTGHITPATSHSSG
jgi:hypothetical protein